MNKGTGRRTAGNRGSTPRVMSALLVLMVACLAHAADDTFRLGGNQVISFGDTLSPYGNYLFEAKALRTNLAMIDCADRGFDTVKVRRILDSARADTIRVLLKGASLGHQVHESLDVQNQAWWNLDLFTMSQGRKRPYVSSALRSAGDIGHVEGTATVVWGDSTGYFQSQAMALWNWTWLMRYTAVYRLRADTAGGGGLQAPVCSIQVVLVPSESVVACSVLTCADFPDRNTEQDFRLGFFKRRRDSLAQYRFRVFSFGNADTLWSEQVEIYDLYSDGLLNQPKPLAAEVSYIRNYWNDAAGGVVYRYMVKDEPEDDMYPSIQAINAVLNAPGVGGKGVITWTPANPQRFADAISPQEIWVDAYPLWGRTFPSGCTLATGRRVPVDCGDYLQARLDSMCTLLEAGRVAAMSKGIPMWFDVQAFGEYWCPDNRHIFNEDWNSLLGPDPNAPDTGRHDESVWREPTPRELRCMSWLALAQGARGLTYWLFPTQAGDFWTADTQKFFYLLGLMAFRYDTLSGPWWYHGYPEGHRPIFDTVLAQNSAFAQLGPTLMSLTFSEAGRWNSAPIDFIHNASDNSLHFGTFTGPGGRYFIVVNRHCLPTDTTTATVTIRTGIDPVRLRDVLTESTLYCIPGGSQDERVFQIPLPPGGGRLLRLVDSTGWVPAEDLPLGAGNRRVGDGGSLVCVQQADTDRIYAFKGNNRYEFLAYNIRTDAWGTRESIPAVGRSGSKKAVKKGGALARSGGKLYAVKGNNTLEFWQYEPASHVWEQKADVPTGNKRLKEGVGLIGVQRGDTPFVYLLKGSSTREFCRYNCQSNTWEAEEDAPLGASGQPYRLGSSLTGNESGTKLYALKGSYNEFSVYDIASGVW